VASGSSTTWTVRDLKVKVGDHVKKGDHLATASTADLTAQMTAAIAGRRSAALQLQIANETLAAASGTTAIRQAQLQVYSAQSQLVQAQKTQRDLDAQIAAATLVAPIDGIVTAVNIGLGLDAPSGDAIVVESANFQVSADVVESDVTSISVGQAATVTVAAINSQIDGTVSAIAPAASAATNGGVVTFAVTVTLATTPPGLRPGMSADIQVTTASATNVLTIPSAALRGSAGSYAVQVLDSAGLPQARQVTVGLVTNTLAEIKSGLSAGESVVTGTTATRTGTTTQGGGVGIPGGGGGGFIRGGGG
jgi:RND family efflux transporter MFP subunit